MPRRPKRAGEDSGVWGALDKFFNAIATLVMGGTNDLFKIIGLDPFFKKGLTSIDYTMDDFSRTMRRMTGKPLFEDPAMKWKPFAGPPDDPASTDPRQTLPAQGASTLPYITQQTLPLLSGATLSTSDGASIVRDLTNGQTQLRPDLERAMASNPDLKRLVELTMNMARDYNSRNGGNVLNPFVIANQWWNESRYQLNATSPKGARGIVQFMPDIARKHGITDSDFANNPEKVMRAGVEEMGELSKKYGNHIIAMFAYSGGPRAISGPAEALIRRGTIKSASELTLDHLVNFYLEDRERLQRELKEGKINIAAYNSSYAIESLNTVLMAFSPLWSRLSTALKAQLGISGQPSASLNNTQGLKSPFEDASGKKSYASLSPNLARGMQEASDLFEAWRTARENGGHDAGKETPIRDQRAPVLTGPNGPATG